MDTKIKAAIQLLKKHKYRVSIDAPNSHVNVMCFILKCLNASNPRYLEDTQHIIRHESHEDYGKTKLLKQ